MYIVHPYEVTDNDSVGNIALVKNESATFAYTLICYATVLIVQYMYAIFIVSNLFSCQLKIRTVLMPLPYR